MNVSTFVPVLHSGLRSMLLMLPVTVGCVSSCGNELFFVHIYYFSYQSCCLFNPKKTLPEMLTQSLRNRDREIKCHSMFWTDKVDFVTAERRCRRAVLVHRDGRNIMPSYSTTELLGQTGGVTAKSSSHNDQRMLCLK